MIGIAELKKMYDSAWKLFVQPPKRRYNPSELSEDPTVILGSLMYVPFSIRNGQDNNLKCHAFVPTQQGDYQNMRTNFIVYAHAQGSNSLEGSFLLPICDKLGIGLCLFDFAGSGNSEGEFVTLGITEANDLNLVVYHLQTNYKVQRIGLWGRSMGAVSILLYAGKPSAEISCAVYDVPYYELESCGVHFAKNKLKVSSFLTKIVLNFIANKIKEQIGFDIFETKTGNVCKDISVPAVLIASYNDELVPFEDFEKIFNSYGSRSIKMLITNKSHGDPREPQLIAEAAQSLVNALIGTNHTLDEIVGFMRKDHDELMAKRFSNIKTSMNTSILSNSDLHALFKPPNSIRSSINQSSLNKSSIRKFPSMLGPQSMKRDSSYAPMSKYREPFHGFSRSKSPITQSRPELRISKKPSVFAPVPDHTPPINYSYRESRVNFDEYSMANTTPIRTSGYNMQRSKSPLHYDMRSSPALVRRGV